MGVLYKSFEKLCYKLMDDAIEVGRKQIREDLKRGKIDNKEFALRMATNKKDYNNYLKK